MGNIHTMVCECNAFCHKTTSHVSTSAGGSSDVWGRMRISLLTSYGSSDEASFSRGGTTNMHNAHVWAHENPHWTRNARFQHEFRINVWAGLLGDRIIGPVYLPARLTGVAYTTFLRDDIPRLLEDVPLLQRQRMWYQHDGAPAHFSRQARAHLQATYGRHCIGRGAPVAWPARAPDLKPLGFFPGGTGKPKRTRLWDPVAKSLVKPSPQHFGRFAPRVKRAPMA